MDIEAILIIIGIILTYSSVLITAWINVRIKLKELDIRMSKLENDFNTQCDSQQRTIEIWNNNIREIKMDIKEHNNKLDEKLNTLISRFDDFRVDVEKRVK
jgi:uncharacterized coiled-coil protein SlyX